MLNNGGEGVRLTHFLPLSTYIYLRTKSPYLKPLYR
ncbi:hypothetical protein C8R30_1391, partial [Nitrosomonas nitrosa]